MAEKDEKKEDEKDKKADAKDKKKDEKGGAEADPNQKLSKKNKIILIAGIAGILILIIGIGSFIVYKTIKAKRQAEFEMSQEAGPVEVGPDGKPLPVAKDDGHGKAEEKKDDGHGKAEEKKDDGHGKKEEKTSLKTASVLPIMLDEK